MKRKFAMMFLLQVIVVAFRIAAVVTEETTCGGTISGSELDYPGTGSKYPNYKLCEWNITKGFTYVITFLRFNVEHSSKCRYDYLQVDVRGRLCGTKIPLSFPIDKDHGTFHMTFRSDGMTTGKGFHIKIVKVPDNVDASCDGNISENTFHFTTNTSRLSCNWLFKRNYSFYVHFKRFHIFGESDILCWIDLDTTIDNELGRACWDSRSKPSTLYCSKGRMQLMFVSGGNTSGSEFDFVIKNAEVNVSSNGTNNRDCGSLKRPCRTISYVIDVLYKTSHSVMIKVLSDITEESTITITRSVSISIEGVGHPKPVLTHTWSHKFFDISSQFVNLTMKNIDITMREMNSFIYVQTSTDTFALTMQQVSLQRVKGLGNSKQEKFVLRVHSDHVDIEIHSCTFNNFNILTTNKKSLCLFKVQVYKVGSFIISNSSFRNNTFEQGLIGFFPFRSSSKVSVRGCIFEQNSGRLMYVFGSFRSFPVTINMTDTYILNNQGYGENALLDVKHDEYVVRHDEYGYARNMFFKNVTADNNNGIVIDASRIQDEVLITSCTFSNNTASSSGSVIVAHSKKGSLFSTKLVIVSSKFYRNIATTGGAVTSSVHTTIMHSKFHKNEASKGGAISISGFAVLSDSEFVVNQATIGGAIYLTNKFNFRINVSVTSCDFTKNTAVQRGGAIVTADESLEIMVVIESSVFSENDAASGGAISSNVFTLIRQSEFILNWAGVGGAMILWTKDKFLVRHTGKDTFKISAISDSNITTDTNAFDTSTELIVANLYIRHLSQNGQGNSVKLFNHDSLFQFFQLAGKITFECGLNHNMDKETMEATDEALLKSNGPATYVLKSFSRFSVVCNPCAKGSYNAENTVATWSVSSRNDTEHVSKSRGTGWQNNSMDHSTSTNKCFPCPLGGNCSSGPLKSRVGYWGFKRRHSAEIAFTKCPEGYCSSEPRSYDSCSKNRGGTLCSDCKGGTSLGVLVSTCVDNDKCEYEPVYFILGFYPCILTVFITYMIYKDKLSRLFQRLVKSVKVCCKCCKGNSEESQIDQESGDDSISTGSSSMAQVLRILSFYQLQVLLYIPNRLLQEKAISKVWNYMERVLGMVSMLNFNGGGNASETTEYCFPKEFTFILRSLLNVFINLSPILLSLIVLSFVCCWEQVKGRQNPLKLQIQSALVYLISWFYIPVIIFKLVTCVTIVQDSVEVPLLFSQASVQCYSVWQYGIILFISVYLAWYFLFLYVGTLYLKRKMYKEFLIMACIPISSLYFFLKFQNNRQSRGKSSLIELSSKTDYSGESVELESVITNINGEHVESTTEEHITNMSPRQINDHTTLHCKKLVEIIQAPCRYPYWPSVLFLQKFCVGLMPVIFRNDYSQTLSLMVILFVYLFILVHKKPYTDPILNTLEPILMSLLLLLGAFGIINTAYQSNNDNNIQSLLIIVDYLKFIILLCPFPFWIILVIVNKCLNPDTKDKIRDPTCMINRDFHDDASLTSQNLLDDACQNTQNGQDTASKTGGQTNVTIHLTTDCSYVDTDVDGGTHADTFTDAASQTTQNLKETASQTTDGNLMVHTTDECQTSDVDTDDQTVSCEVKYLLDELVTEALSQINDEKPTGKEQILMYGNDTDISAEAERHVDEMVTIRN